MKLSDFDYKLPDSSIAQQAAEPRDSSKLLCINPQTQVIEEKVFHQILDLLTDNDVLVLNKTKVIPARLNGYYINGVGEEKKCEIFLHKQINASSWDCLVYPGQKLKPGKDIYFTYNSSTILHGKIVETTNSGRKVEFFYKGDFMDIIQKIGSMPLPPYIKENSQDNERYQTVFNEIAGSVAAPTAGLHFTPELLHKIEQKDVKIEKVLLHVGLGTFKSVETENILEHQMHAEYIELDTHTAKRLNTYKKNGKRIIAVGTTSIRVLESFSNETGHLESGTMDTKIFIYPGYRWKFVDAIITNFHLPKSTLLMLVSSFAGRDFILKAYNYAIKNNFRFFSYGDAMFIQTKNIP